VPGEHRIAVAVENGNETILVVEDEKSVRSFAVAALKRYGYHVIEASDGDEAIAVAEQHSGRIQLLLTDVIMPGMNGKVLSERLKELYRISRCC
jgi:two-component system cell cycle sensor histidine kinase/response regulator CckA